MNAARFWAKVLWLDDSPDSCAIWCGSVDAHGYGRVRVQGRLRSARRVAYELTHGPIPENALVKQRCHEHACCRPEHLYLEQRVRLTAEQVEAIRTSPLGCRRLARASGVTFQRIAQIRASFQAR